MPGTRQTDSENGKMVPKMSHPLMIRRAVWFGGFYVIKSSFSISIYIRKQICIYIYIYIILSLSMLLKTEYIYIYFS